MSLMKRLIAVVSLTIVLGATALAGDPPTCAPDPGIMQTPPCSIAQPATDDSTVPGQIPTPPASQSVDLVTVAEDAITTLLLFTVS
jgi:hypothetical protein